MNTEAKTLIVIIKAETKDLFANYLVQLDLYYRNQYENFIKWTETEIVEVFGTRSIYSGVKIRSKQSERFAEKVRKIKRQGVESYVSDNIINAKANYESATEKLAYTIIKKGINVKNMKATSVSLKVGQLQTIFTDGIQSVKAQTIYACGEVNAPHYRYLVK